ncbi:hypothetical protein [Saccharopolyspora shandongensis]|uniref:hypothetical protein n=1 Tax=Saccharopolyspora shandongensis TaxID=418495 RepID=UPI0033F835F1
MPEPPIGPVAVLDADDFAVRRGHRYGTVMVDLDTRKPVDLIDGRDGADPAVWLAARRRGVLGALLLRVWTSTAKNYITSESLFWEDIALAYMRRDNVEVAA